MSFELTTLASTPQVLTNRATKTTVFFRDIKCSTYPLYCSYVLIKRGFRS